jgi:hypothetical protein
MALADTSLLLLLLLLLLLQVATGILARIGVQQLAYLVMYTF